MVVLTASEQAWEWACESVSATALALTVGSSKVGAAPSACPQEASATPNQLCSVVLKIVGLGPTTPCPAACCSR